MWISPDDTERYLRKLGSSEGPEAYEQLMQAAARVLNAYLRWLLPIPDDRVDVIREVQLRVWRSRDTYEYCGVAAWWRFIKRIADNCAVDLIRARGPETQIEDPILAEIPEGEVWMIAEVVVHLDERRSLYDAADELWLGPKTTDHHAKLLVAKLLYVDQMPWEQVLRMLQGVVELNRAKFDEWASDPCTLRHLTYEQLYYSNDKLCEHLLGVEPAVTPLDRIARRCGSGEYCDNPPGGWSWPEVCVILYRFRYAMLIEQVARLRNCSLSEAQIREVTERCVATFPFKAAMQHLLAATAGPSRIQTVLAAPGTWQRLVFQYSTADDLPQRDIHDRTSPAAALAGYKLTAGMLNVWLSNRRLLRRLVDHCARRRGAHEP
jgi:DNA-directed RNA polymerase specialized sigma24 family protein